MIQWQVFINSTEEHSCVELSHKERLQIKETDSLLFVVQMSTDDFSTWGSPTIVLGDIPLIMSLHENVDNDFYTFISNEPIASHKSKFFYNFFGESEVTLYFDNKYQEAVTVTFDILARKENAVIANEMLNFLTENIEDAIAICFSRSKRGADLTGDNGHNFNKVDAIDKTVHYLRDSIQKFVREKKSSIDLKMILSENGQPTGPDSVYWALTNLDKLSPANEDSVNIYFNNRGYHYDKLPKEISEYNYDVYENRVINSFLAGAEIFLTTLKNEYNVEHEYYQDSLNPDYVRFDHTMARFSKMALDVKVKEIESLVIKVRELRSLYLRILPSRFNVLTLPKITSFVAKKSHYREAFSLIEKCYRAPAPDFSKNKLLLGLKNLSIIYELTALLMLHKEIENTFHTNVCIQNFRAHDESYPFGGIDEERPEGIINNHFVFTSPDYLIDLLYEARIYPYSDNRRPGDLIDTSNTHGSIKYGKHHFCPDFVLKITSKKWGNTFTVILDAKFKDINTIKYYDFESLTNKYLLNIHSISNDGDIKISPIDMLIILFAHSKHGNTLRSVAPRHCVTGQFPVFPQSTAIALHPNEPSLLSEHLNSMRNLISKGLGIRFS
ncbi:MULTISPECIES: hypothetical protein [Pseudescherichia]|uniref:hypothetical protein n=1 Tax=Pseudescherichia TaxID=2055880 RepID=UPI00301C4020